ncbi:MAG: NAD-dependent dehydratase [Acidobacteria bacterium]|nr:MAG: NAD-dependent dehydratase [Acidobacteriota bacterium]
MQESRVRIVVIGGTGFIGSVIVQQLHERGHELLRFHRRRSSSALREIIAERDRLADYRTEFRNFKPDTVLDTILSSARQADTLMRTFRGIAERVIALSSMDVYRACGVIHRTEPGPPDPIPLTENSPLRTKPAYPPERIRTLKNLFSWVDDEYDKVGVEQVVISDSGFPGTVLRLPMVYGPHDPLHRFFPILKRISDGRSAIILDERVARWRGSRGYVENVAAAIVAAIESNKAKGRIYNVAEPVTFSEEEWTKKICEAVHWSGRIVKLPSNRMPPHL